MAPHSIAAEPGSVAGNTSVHHGVNPWIDASKDNLSTFAADVDTAIADTARTTADQNRDRLELVGLIEKAAKLRSTPLVVASPSPHAAAR